MRAHGTFTERALSTHDSRARPRIGSDQTYEGSNVLEGSYLSLTSCRDAERETPIGIGGSGV